MKENWWNDQGCSVLFDVICILSSVQLVDDEN